MISKVGQIEFRPSQYFIRVTPDVLHYRNGAFEEGTVLDIRAIKRGEEELSVGEEEVLISASADGGTPTTSVSGQMYFGVYSDTVKVTIELKDLEGTKIYDTKSVLVIRDGADGKPGAAGPSYYPAGKYSDNISYTRNATQAPVVELEGMFYGQLKVGTIKGINPKTDVANNDGNWEVFDMFKYIFTEVAFILFGKLGSAIFNGDFMFSQHGVNSSGVANQDYTAFNPSLADPTTNASFMPNILLNLLTGKVWFRDAVIGGSLTARALKRKVAHGGSGSYTSLADCSGFYLDGDFSMPVLSEDTFMDLHGMVLQPAVMAIVAIGTIFFPSSDNTVYYNGFVYTGVRYLKYQHSGGFIKVQFHGTSPSGYSNCWFIQVESSIEFTFTVELYS